MTRTNQMAWILGLLISITSAAHAQTGNGYDLTWNTLDGGGGTVTGGTYSLSSTFGQHDSGEVTGGT